MAILGAHAWGTHQRNRVWRDGETLWRDVVEKSPGNGRAWMNYGLAKMGRGQYGEALRLYEEASKRTPNYSFLHINLAIAQQRLGHPQEAERHYLRSLTLVPDLAIARYYYGQWLIGQGARAKPSVIC